VDSIKLEDVLPIDFMKIHFIKKKSVCLVQNVPRLIILEIKRKKTAFLKFLSVTLSFVSHQVQVHTRRLAGYQ
jgi:hypothetical protein